VAKVKVSAVVDNRLHNQMVGEGNNSSNQTIKPVESEKVSPKNFDQEEESVIAGDEHGKCICVRLRIRSEHDRAAQAAGEIVEGGNCCH